MLLYGIIVSTCKIETQSQTQLGLDARRNNSNERRKAATTRTPTLMHGALPYRTIASVGSSWMVIDPHRRDQRKISLSSDVSMESYRCW
jgi:hypothetical protein